MSTIELSSIEQAIAFIHGLDDPDYAEAKVSFNGELRTLEIEIEGPLFHGELTGELARGLAEFQDELYRAARFAITGKEGRESRLTIPQKEALELRIEVNKGCTLIKIDVGKFGDGLLQILQDSVSSMTPLELTGFVVAVVAVLGVAWIGKTAVVEHFKEKTASAEGGQETERLKAAADAPVRVVEQLAAVINQDKRIERFAMATEKGLTEVAARATDATSVKMGRVELDDAALAALHRRSPKSASENIHEIGDFRILHVNGSVSPFKLTLGGASMGEFDIEFDPAEFTPEQDDLIWDAARTRRMVRLEVKAIQLRDKIKGAVLLDIFPAGTN